VIRFRSSQIAAALSLVLLTMSACAPGSDADRGSGTPDGEVSTPAVEGASPEAELTPSTGSSGTLENGHACNHPFFPAVVGGTWTYAGVDSIAGPYSFTDTITSMQDDGFTLTGDFGDLVRTQQWSCSEAGLAVLDYEGMGAAQVSTSGLNFELETTGVSGVTLPIDLAPGSTWTQSFTLSGLMSLAGAPESSASGTAIASNEAIGFETVEVPAGSFEALRIERTIEINLLVSVGESTLPVAVSSVETTWFAEGVGWIRSSFTGTIQDQALDESIELTAFSIP
jgi:hypothetical protein